MNFEFFLIKHIILYKMFNFLPAVLRTKEQKGLQEKKLNRIQIKSFCFVFIVKRQWQFLKVYGYIKERKGV